MDDDVLKSVTSDTETEASKSEQGEETMSVQDVKEPRPKEKVKPTANEEKPDQTVSPLDTPSQKESEPEASDVDPSTEEAPAFVQQTHKGWTMAVPGWCSHAL